MKSPVLAAARWSVDCVDRVDKGAVLFVLVAAGLLAYINTLFGYYTGFHTGVNNDSSGYLEWYWLRTPGYPAFIHVVHALTGDLRWLGAVQLNLLLLSFITLAYGLGRLSGSRGAALSALLLLFGLTPLIAISMQIWNESPIAAIICFHLAGLCFYLRRPSLSAAACISATVALIYLVRPAALPFAGTLPLLFIIPLLRSSPDKEKKTLNNRYRRSRESGNPVLFRWIPAFAGMTERINQTFQKRLPFLGLLVAVAVPLLAGLLTMGTLNKLKHDSFSVTSHGGPFLLGHVARLLQAEDGVGTEHEQLIRDLAVEFAPYQQRTADAIASGDPRRHWQATRDVSSVIWRRILPTIHAQPSDLRGLERNSEVTAAAMDVSLITIMAHPWQYAEHLWVHYRAFWQYAFLSWRPDLPSYAQWSYRHARERLAPCVGESRSHCGFQNIFAGYMDTDHFFDDAALAQVDARATEATVIGRLWWIVVDHRQRILGAIFALSLLSLALLPLAVMQGGKESGAMIDNRTRGLVLFCAFVAVMLQLNALFITAVHPAIHRYTMPLLPLLPVLIVGMTVVLSRVLGRLAMRRANSISEEGRHKPMQRLTDAISHRLPAWAYLAACGGIFMAVMSGFGYAWIPADYYHARDDGVITMSHGRNLVEYGFIGVGPSGERVEGYSAPVQFFVHALSYWLTGAHYSALAGWQTLVCTFLLGMIASAFFLGPGASFLGRSSAGSSLGAFHGKMRAMLATAALALALCFSMPFLLWHASGMENAITHVLFAAAVLCLFRFGAQGRIGWFALPLLFLASISRVESGFHIFPLLMVFSIYWLIVHRSFKAVWFSAGVFGLWLLFNGWRYLYFGDWVPNTSPAQGISLSARLNALQSLDANYLADSVWHGKEILRRNGALYLLLLAPLAFLVDWKRHWTLLTLLVLCSVVTAFIYPFAFGPTRIDYPRTNTSLALIVWLTVLYFAARVQTTKVTGARGNLLGLALALIIAFTLPQSYRSPYILGWSTGGFESYRREFARAAAAHGLGTATVSNVDLGAISWYKQFNIVDLGGLGSKTMTAVPYGPLMSEYWFELAAPDLLETRPYWSCVFQDRIFKDARFSARYTPLREEFPEHSVARCAGQQLPRGVYIRRDVMQGADSAERRFIDALQRQPTLQVIADELAACVSLQAAGDPYACAYIARAVYREKPRLLESSSAAELAALFEASPTAAFDAFLIQGHADNAAYKPAILALFDLLVESKGMQQVGADGGFTVYANRRFIAYRNTQCTAADYRNPFYLHIHADADSPDYYNIGSRMSTHGFRADNVCIAAQRLPADGVARITTGQWDPVAQNFAWQITFLP